MLSILQRFRHISHSSVCACIREKISSRVIHRDLCKMHSSIADMKLQSMEVKILPALADNYMYLFICKSTREAAIVDPVDPEVAIDEINKANVTLSHIFTTHHHWDHAGGNEKFVKMFHNPVNVYGGDDRIPALTHKVTNNQHIHVGNLDVTCLTTPCHTSGHICYLVQSNSGDICVFTGDTLFQGGCGRFFEGTPEQMYNALFHQLASLPDDTNVFCGHEYTLQNMAYALHVEPENQAIVDRIEWAKKQRSNQAPTVPSTIGQEKIWNPFMRVHVRSVQTHANETDPIRTMGFLRREKDKFKA